MLFTCPVCGFDRLDEPPERYYICPCCGTEFENDDDFKSHAELRDDWIRGGAKWWSEADDQPEGWSAGAQLARLLGNRLATDVTVTDSSIRVVLNDGETIGVPLTLSKRLFGATIEQRNNWRLMGGGTGIHWEDVDEDLLVAALVIAAIGGETLLG